jgi:hypothetical protein
VHAAERALAAHGSECSRGRAGLATLPGRTSAAAAWFASQAIALGLLVRQGKPHRLADACGACFSRRPAVVLSAALLC